MIFVQADTCWNQKQDGVFGKLMPIFLISSFTCTMGIWTLEEPVGNDVFSLRLQTSMCSEHFLWNSSSSTSLSDSFWLAEESYTCINAQSMQVRQKCGGFWTAVIRVLQISNVFTNVDILCWNSLQINKDPFQKGASCFLFFFTIKKVTKWVFLSLFKDSIHTFRRSRASTAFFPFVVYNGFHDTWAELYTLYFIFLLQKLLNKSRDSFRYLYRILCSLWGLYS